MQQKIIDLQHRLHLAEQSIMALEKSNYSLSKEMDFLKKLVKTLNQKIEQPIADGLTPHEPPPPHY